MSLHELKTWPEYFEYLWDGSKTFEVRIDDREYDLHDHLHLREWVPGDDRYTGRELISKVIYIMDGKEGAPMGLERGYVVMALERVMWSNPNGRCGGWYPDDGYRLDAPGAFTELLAELRA